MTTRFLGKNDIDSIISLEKGFIDAWNKSMIESSFNSGLFYAIGCFECDKLISYISFSLATEEADIDMVFTSESYRRQGLAKELIDKAISFLKERKIKRVFLEVREQNEKAIALYNKCGFSFVSVRKKYYADGDNAIIYKREL